MRKAVLVGMLIVMAAGFLLTGCATVVESPDVRNRRTKEISDLQMRMMVEDWDYIWLYERNTGMTQWHPWVGI